ncbi:glycine-rich protein DOT1-like [Spinacia oleracea]|uniref:Glycine-rich protein DOT1-like n=1 Tax=Spinacia oleracea TaxID=3562 RepID=A0ABM3R3J2_SPIOL|nr:glycine-rich protein DOT1-like [Spinacia oleracea]
MGRGAGGMGIGRGPFGFPGGMGRGGGDDVSVGLGLGPPGFENAPRQGYDVAARAPIGFDAFASGKNSGGSEGSGGSGGKNNAGGGYSAGDSGSFHYNIGGGGGGVSAAVSNGLSTAAAPVQVEEGPVGMVGMVAASCVKLANQLSSEEMLDSTTGSSKKSDAAAVPPES